MGGNRHFYINLFNIYFSFLNSRLFQMLYWSLHWFHHIISKYILIIRVSEACYFAFFHEVLLLLLKIHILCIIYLLNCLNLFNYININIGMTCTIFIISMIHNMIWRWIINISIWNIIFFIQWRFLLPNLVTVDILKKCHKSSMILLLSLFLFFRIIYEFLHNISLKFFMFFF